jgi:hypothetical protein
MVFSFLVASGIADGFDLLCPEPVIADHELITERPGLRAVSLHRINGISFHESHVAYRFMNSLAMR